MFDGSSPLCILSLSSNQISELESERQHLSDAVASLQERAQSNSEARVCEVEAENSLLQQNITDISSRVASLESQLRVVTEEAEKLREKSVHCEELERDVMKLERSRDTMKREVITSFVFDVSIRSSGG